MTRPIDDQDENEDEAPNYFNIESQSESSKEIIAGALKSAAKQRGVGAAGKGNKSGGAGGKKSRRKSAGSSTKQQQEEKQEKADNELSPEEAARQVSLERELTNRYLSGELTFQVFFEPFNYGVHGG